MAIKMSAGEEMWTSCATVKYNWLLWILCTHLKFWGETSLGWPTLRSEVSHRFWLYTFLLNSGGATPRHWRQLLWVGTTSPGSTLRCRSCSRYPITLSRRRSGVRVDLSSKKCLPLQLIPNSSIQFTFTQHYSSFITHKPASHKWSLSLSFSRKTVSIMYAEKSLSCEFIKFLPSCVHKTFPLCA